MSIRSFGRDLALAFGLLVLLVLFFWPVTVGGRTLVPADALYMYQPWAATAPAGSPYAAYNGLVQDLVLENYVWKQFVLQSLHSGQLPLWNPYILSGVPFLAAGQHSALYPFSVIYYVFPLPRAYGLFTVSQYLIAGLALYYFARTIRLSRFAAAAGGLVFAFSGFMLVSVAFPMIIAAAAWLPFLLAMVERLLQAMNASGTRPLRERLRAPVPWLILGSLGLGLQFLAGHVEIAYYNLLVVGAYAAWRGVAVYLPGRRWRGLLSFGAAFVLLIGLGAGLGAIQTLPLFELVTKNFREGSVTYEQIIGWAYPKRRLLAFLIPDFFGNPVQHSYIDLYTGQSLPVLRDALGRLKSTEWGIKNYVEGGAYVSILGLALAIFGALRRPRTQPLFFVALGLFSLSLVFGLPTYRLVYLLPGIRQLHSPFRWVFPYTVCVAILAAHGVDTLVERAPQPKGWRLPAVAGGLCLLAGLGVLAGIAAARAFPQYILPLADRAVASLARANEAFADGRMFLSYQAGNLWLFALCLLGAALVLLTARSIVNTKARGQEASGSTDGPIATQHATRSTRHATRPTHHVSRFTFDVSRLTSHGWQLALLAVLVVDPALWFHKFPPAVDPSPLSDRPAAVRFLQQLPQPFRITVYDTKGTKLLPANTSMLFGLSDIRGYDSIIPKPYTEVMKRLDTQELEYNQIARLTHAEALDSPILDLLNVRYVLTEEKIERPHYTLVYDGELRIYRNDDCLPRAFVTFRARTYADREDLLEDLPRVDPRQAVLLEEVPQTWQAPSIVPAAPAVEFVEDSPNQVRLRVDMPAAGFLVLADNHFPGWVAYTTVDGATAEQPLPILRAYGTLRAVQLPAGPQTVRFKYSPNSIKVGAFVTFMAGMSLLLLGAVWLWGRLYSGAAGEQTARRVARNTVAPLAMQLLNKGIDTAFAMLAVRLLGPDNQGKYYFAIYVALLLETVTNFGLNTLLTREVARERQSANRYLWNTSILRLSLAALSAPVLLLFLLLYRPMPADTALAIVLLAIGLVPSGISAGLSAVFMAFEVMEIPAVITTVTTLLKVALGTAVLLLGWGFVGLAGTSVVVNGVTMAILLMLLSRLFFRPRPEPEPGLPRRLAFTAYPLMLNHLLATLFFKIDVVLLQRLWGDAVVGWYSIPYKWVDAIGIIPPTFTMAIFPLMSRLASSSREALHRAYLLSIKLLFSLGLLIALLSTALAYPLTAVLGGSAYLPHSAIAMQLMVWYMPLGFVNSVTQYVLIALDQQRFLTRAFAFGLAFGAGANLLLIPRFGYQAAAAVHIVAELALLIPFYMGVRRHLAPIPWLRILWRPSAAGAIAGSLFWLLRAWATFVVAPLAGAVYLALLLAFGTFDTADRATLAQVLPVDRILSRLRKGLAARTP